MTTLKEKLIKVGANVVSHGRYVAFQMAHPGTQSLSRSTRQCHWLGCTRTPC
jgi:hypothetical protein